MVKSFAGPVILDHLAAPISVFLRPSDGHSEHHQLKEGCDADLRDHLHATGGDSGRAGGSGGGGDGKW